MTASNSKLKTSVDNSEISITDDALLKAVNLYIDISGRNRMVFIRELQSLSEQIVEHRFDIIFDSLKVTSIKHAYSLLTLHSYMH